MAITATEIMTSYFADSENAEISLKELNTMITELRSLSSAKRAEIAEVARANREANLDAMKERGEAYFLSLADGDTFEVTYKGKTEVFTRDSENAKPKSGKYGSAWGMFNGEAKKVTFDKVIVPADFEA